MSAFVVPCPRCLKTIKVPASKSGRWIACPGCTMEFAAMRDDEPADTADSEPRHHERDWREHATEHAYYPHAEPSNDLPGVMGIVFGGITVVCLFPAIITQGVLGIFFLTAIPFPMIGAGLSFCSRSRLRAGGLAFNLIGLGIAVCGLVLANAGVFSKPLGLR